MKFYAKHGVMVLCLLVSSCLDEPCSRLEIPEDYADCPALCGEDEPTAVSCHRGTPFSAPDVSSGGHEYYYEYSTVHPWVKGYWRMGREGQDTIEILAIPYFIAALGPEARYHEEIAYPTPASFPYPMFRSSGAHYAHSADTSIYFHYTVGEDECVIEVASVMTFSFPSGGEYERSSRVVGMEGPCELSGYEFFYVGKTWKTIGKIIRTGTCPGADPPFGCDEDGWCNKWCRVDFDCPCHHDGECTVYRCPGDRDCGCGQDFICIENCGNDPDCACVRDNSCNMMCGPADPDCDCNADNICSCECLRDDPDCLCGAEGACNPTCGWADEDCLCVEESVCNPDCGAGDPDC